MFNHSGITRALIKASMCSGHSNSPYTKVGCVIITQSGEIIGTGWNHTNTQYDIVGLEREEFRNYVAHAEINALSRIKPYARDMFPRAAVCTLMPCVNCLNSLHAFGVSHVYYKEELERDFVVHKIAFEKGMELIKIANV